VHQRFILSAKKLALETPLSMKEIAYKLGFEDAAHFSKFFKINAGINFSAYKRNSILTSGTLNNSQKE
jgi:AraC-like DNA-binding protein